MASSLVSNNHHIDFDSVFDMDDAGLAQVFETLIATGLRNFLGCPAVFYKEALLEFFTNGSVREDGMVFSTIRGTTVEISESLFATAFDFPTEGLTDLSDVPKNLVFDARSLFSESKEQVSISCLKKELKIQYRLLHDILAKTLFVKAGSFDAVTRDRFLLMTAITFDVKVNWSNLLFGVLQGMVTPGSRQAKGFAIQIGVLLQNVQGLVLGESKGFPKSRILDAKTVHRFVHINEKVGLDESAASSRVKKTPVNKVVSKKRQVGAGEEAPVMKKKRTTKGKPVVIAQEVVPLQTVEAIEVDEPVPAFVEQPAVVPVVEGTTEDLDAVIEQILHQLDTVGATDGGEHPAPTTKESIPWFDLPVFLARREAEGFVGSSSDTDEDLIADQPIFHLFPDAGDQPHVSEIVVEGMTDDELLSIEEHQARIPFNASLPSTLAPTITPIRFGQGIEFREVDAYKANLLRHMREHQLEWTRPSSSSLFEGPVIDRGFFIPPNHHSITSKCWIRAKIMVDGSWLILEGVDYWRPINLKVLKLLGAAHLFALKDLLRHMREHQLEWTRPSSSSLFEGPVIDRVQDIDSRPSLSRAISIVWAEICMEAVQFSLLGSLRPVGSVNFCRDLVVRGSVVEVIETLPNHFRRIIRQGIDCNCFVDFVVQLDSVEIHEVDVQGIDEVDLVSSEDSTVYRSPSPIFQETDSFDSPVHLNGDDIPLEENVNVQTTLPATTVDLSPLLDDLKTSLSQRMDDAHSDILSRLHTIERSLQNTLGHQNDYFRNLILSARQEGQTQDDLQILHLNELKKTVMAQSVTADTDSLAIRNRFNALDAKILLLDGQIAAIRIEQLEFQEKWQQIFSASPPRLEISSTTFVAVMPKRGKEAAVAALYLLLLTKVKAVVMLSELQRLSHKQTLTLHNEISWKE
ncbi:hypothetical protein F511_06301 [Dorcoceras hygrometricum]|uniref:Dystroglycan-like n=1 Tax=Dorcoceras hygrometricum TaxID=472368 RepID=A0A2Z7AEM2_9LAMI|nr:hypothetical protein F511_06301 [Dorcoceras hygrometricum]